VTSLRCSLDYSRLDDFVTRFARNLSRAGVFLPMREPLELGSPVRFEIVLADAQVALRGEGTVSFRAPYEPGANDRLHGIGIRLTKLDAPSREVIERVMAYKATHPAEFFEPARDPILAPSSPFAFVAPPEPAPTKAAAASESARPVASPHGEPVKTAVAATGAGAQATGAQPAVQAVAPAPTAPPTVSPVPTPVTAPAAATPAAVAPPVGAVSAPTATTTQTPVVSKEPPASQKTPLRPISIPRATLPSKGTPRPSAQTPLVALGAQGSDKTPVPTGGDGAASVQPAKSRPSDSAQTPKVELPLPAAASGPRRWPSDSTKTPSHSSMTPVVRLDAALKESSRSQPAPSSTTSGRGRTPDERSRHEADEELASLRTPASPRSAATPDASKRLQELLTRRPSGKE
jgi:Tfp pilus assembly protein PilZ